MAFNVEYLYIIKDRFTAPLRKITQHTKKYNRALKRSAVYSRRLSRATEKMGEKMSGLGSVFSSAALILSGKKLISLSVNMEDAMADLARVTPWTNKQLVKFEDTIERLSESLGKSKLGMAEMAFEAAKMKIPLNEMEEFLIIISQVAIAFDGLSDQEAGSIISELKTKIGLTVKETAKLADMINYLADNTTAKGAPMIEIIRRLSGTMSTIKAPTEAIAGFAALASQLGTSPEIAASGLEQMLTRMRRMPGMMRKLTTDPMAAVREELVKISKMGMEGREKYVFKKFGDRAKRFVDAAVGKLNLFDEAMETAMSTKAIGSMAREMENQLARSSTALKQFAQTSINTFQKVGDAMTPATVALSRHGRVMMDAFGRLVDYAPIVGELTGSLILVGAGFSIAALAAKVFAIKMGIAFAPLLITLGLVYLAYQVIASHQLKQQKADREYFGNVKESWKQGKTVYDMSEEGLALDKRMAALPRGAEGSARNMAISKAKERIDIQGQIVVKATKGTEVVKSGTELNTGSNYGAFSFAF